MTPPRCLVLGGNGFVGRAMVAEAQRRGYATVAVGREDHERLAGTACDLLINANGNSKKYLADRDPELDFRLSVDSVAQSLDDFTAAHYVYVSSIDVYPNVADPATSHEGVAVDPAPLPPYGRHKRLAEELVRQRARSWLILRTCGLVGPALWKNSIYDMLKDRPLRVHPDSEYQYLHTAVLADMTFDLVERGAWGEVFNAAGDGVLRLRDAAAAVTGYRLRTLAGNAPLERYEVSIEKLKAIRDVPATRATVLQFVADVLAGRERIA